MSSSSPSFEVGDSVRVNEGVLDVDFASSDIGGWQGRIVEIRDGTPTTLVVEWDSVTLAEMPGEQIDAAERKGLDWTQYALSSDDVEKATSRDAPQDVKRERRRIRENHLWTSLGEEGIYIQKILDQTSSDGERTLFRTWETELQRQLSFPVKATVDEFYRGGGPEIGDEVQILSVVFLDCLYGLIATVQSGPQSAQIPLADLEPLDETSDNYLPLRAYRVWFANR